MLSVLFVDGNPARPVKTITDKAYGKTNISVLYMLKLRLMNATDCAFAIEEDQKNKGPQSKLQQNCAEIYSQYYVAMH
jgi:hypothetical protein